MQSTSAGHVPKATPATLGVQDRITRVAVRLLRAIKVELLYFDGCPNRDALLPRLRELVAREGSPAEIDLHRITDDDAAQSARFLGSPTVRVNGRDVEPGAERRTDYGMKCRLYHTLTGLSGQPQDEWLRAALGDARADA